MSCKLALELESDDLNYSSGLKSYLGPGNFLGLRFLNCEIENLSFVYFLESSWEPNDIMPIEVLCTL